MPADPRIADLAQDGEIRLGMFLPQYAKDTTTGEPRGVGPGVVMLEIARALAARLGVKLSIVELPTPRSALDCIKDGGCEFAFLGIEPSRAAEVDFTPAVFQFDYSFLVRPIPRCANSPTSTAREFASLWCEIMPRPWR